MDLREIKTKRNIRNAFIQLRAHKPLERITVKELAEHAEISKATFYLHYHDIYDLSDSLQREVIKKILDSMKQPDLVLSDPKKFTRELSCAFHSEQTLIDILFSGSQASVLPISIEKELKEYIFQLIPEARNDARLNILLSFQIQGGFYAYLENYKQFGMECILDIWDELYKNFSFLKL